MSRVIKSGRLKIESPRLISGTCSHFETIAEDKADDIPITPEQEETIDVAQVKKQAEDIILETEQMVKDLLGTAKQEAEKIIKVAREKSDSLIREGQEQVEAIKEQGLKEGMEAGFAEGMKRAEKEFRSTIDEAKKILQDALEERERIIIEAEDEIIQLSINIAQKIIGQEVNSDRALILKMVEKAFEKVRDREEISLRVNPDNLDAVLEAKEKIISSTQGINKMKVLADPEITAGGCVIETSNGTVDARVERQLQEIEQSLLEVNANG